MGFLGIIYIVFVALVIAAIFSYGFRIAGPWGSFWTFFIVLLLSVWAADVWLSPAGPYWNDVYWVPPLIVGIIVALLLAAATPAARRRKPASEVREPTPGEEASAIAVGTLFWIVVFLLLAAALGGLLFYG